mgnify:CR=1 FL=1
MGELAFNYTRVPTDNLDEWFFICATYDPDADTENEDRAKVEIISKRDLLTARGFKVEEAEEEDEDETVDSVGTGDGIEDDMESTKNLNVPEEVVEETAMGSSNTAR